MPKLKVLMHNPDWGNRWKDYIKDELGCYDLRTSNTNVINELVEQSEDRDVLISMWCSQTVGVWSQLLPQKKIITYLRRFELWSDKFMKSIDFNHVDAMIWVNDYYAEKFHQIIPHNGIKHYIIPNGINLNEWQLRKDYDPYKIALVASMKHVKNIPLAAQILYELPEKYHIHHIGLHTENFTGELFSYVDALGLSDRWHWEPRVESDKVQDWLKDKAFLLNPSINEGNPNCVIEAMAMGIKPIIHAWPGAYGQFPTSLIFRNVKEACDLILNGHQQPEFYRKWVEDRFTIKNFKMLHQVIKDVNHAV